MKSKDGLSFLLLLKNSEPETHGWAVAELKQAKTKLPNRARSAAAISIDLLQCNNRIINITQLQIATFNLQWENEMT